METQCHDFEPGDTIEVRLRHPHNDSTVSVQGNVVWKKGADKFAYVMGVKVNETELDTRLRMLEIMSAAGDVPVDSFLIEKKNDEEREREKAGAWSNDAGTTEMDTARSETPQIDSEDIYPDDRVEEEQISKESTLFTHEESAVSADDSTIWAEYAEARVLRREAMKPGITTSEGDAIQGGGEGPRPFLDNFRRNKNWMYVLIILAAVSVLASVFSLTSSNRDDTVKDSVPPPLTSAPLQQEKKDMPDFPVGDTGPQDVVVEGLPPSIKPDISDELSSKKIQREKPVLRRRRPAETRTADGNVYYIQVGAWRHEDTATTLLSQLKKYYPDAYMERENDLHKVKIPAKDKPEGDRIVKEIKDKFNIASLLVLKK